MDYIQDLRKILGHKPIVLAGATVLILDKENNLLMQKRVDNGTWGIPGGFTEPGEKVEDTVRRETLEETGMELGKLTLIDVYSGPELFYKYPNGDQVYNISVVFLTKEYQVSNKDIDNEGLEIRFMDINKLPDNVSPPIIPILNDIRKKITDGKIRI